MSKCITQMVIGIMVLMMLIPLKAGAQTLTTQPQLAPDASQYTVEQYDQMLAPIALYPDPLLAQILMAATYPLEIVHAARWLQDPNNAALKDDQLAAALEQKPWDPSVKSLVPFPQILRLMNDNLTWTEQLGDAFLAGQAAVMDSVQRLRQKAQAAGYLGANPQEVVSTQDSAIMIEPASPETVYVPVYDPDVAYGMWPYPDFPPYFFPGYFDGAVIFGGFEWFGFGIDVPLWDWGRWDWRRHRIDIDRDRFNAINAHHRPPIGSGAWQHDPSHRHRVPYRDAETRNRFQGESETPDARRSFRGYPTTTAPQSHTELGNQRGMTRQTPRPPLPYRAPSPSVTVVAPQPRPAMGSQRGTAPQQVFRSPQPYQAPSSPPAFESFGRGADVRTQAEQGHASRQSMQTIPDSAGRDGRQPSSPDFRDRKHQ
jgi:hypothetical protein